MYKQPAIVSGTIFHPEMKYSQNGKAYVKFSIGQANGKWNKQTNQMDWEEPIYYPCTFFGTRDTDVSKFQNVTDKEFQITASLEYKPWKGQDGKWVPAFTVRDVLMVRRKPNVQQPPQQPPVQPMQPAPQQQAPAQSFDFDDDIPF